MFLAYLDSSGRANFDDPENFVLTSVITGERNWQAIENGVKGIKLKHFPTLPDSEVEIHAKDMQNHSGIFKTHSWNEIYAIYDDIFDFVAHKDTQLAIIGVIIDKTKLFKDKDIEVWAYRLMFERISRFIQRQNAKLLEAGYQSEYGIMISDSEGEVKDQKLRSKLFGMLRKGTYYSNLEYLIEDPSLPIPSGEISLSSSIVSPIVFTNTIEPRIHRLSIQLDGTVSSRRSSPSLTAQTVHTWDTASKSSLKIRKGG